MFRLVWAKQRLPPMDVAARGGNSHLQTGEARHDRSRRRASFALLIPLRGSCNPGGKVSVHELAEGIEPGQNRRHHVVHLGGILQVRP